MLKIFIIEDDIVWQIKLQVMLEEYGFQITLATSIAEAKQIMLSLEPSVILTDIRLPDGLSFDFFRENPPNAPIVFITEFTDKSYVEQVLAIPFSSFYVKPFHPLTLVAAVQSAYTYFRNNRPKLQVNSSLEVSTRYGQTKEIPFAKISWIEVDGNYSTIQTTDRKYVQKLSLTKLLPNLDDRFIQIHKSVIVNRDSISRINLMDDTVTVKEKVFMIGRSFRKALIQTIDKNPLVHF